MDRIEHGLNTDLIEIHHVFYNENWCKHNYFFEFDSFYCSSIF
jgi:hypothetical protein